MLGFLDTLEKLDDFFRAEHHRQGLWLFRGRDHLVERPLLLERDLVEKAECGHSDEDRPGRQLLLVGQIDLVGTNLLGAQHGGRLAEVPREPRDLLQVGALRMRRQIPHLHVFEHALPKGCHGSLRAKRAWSIPDVRPGAYATMKIRVENRRKTPMPALYRQRALPATAKRFSPTRLMGRAR